MLLQAIPKLPMRDSERTKRFYVQLMKFNLMAEYPNYLIVERDGIELHFFQFEKLNPSQNYGQAYIRLSEIESVYKEFVQHQDLIHPNGALAEKPWGQKEFSILDPDNNLITFGEKGN